MYHFFPLGDFSFCQSKSFATAGRAMTLQDGLNVHEMKEFLRPFTPRIAFFLVISRYFGSISCFESGYYSLRKSLITRRLRLDCFREGMERKSGVNGARTRNLCRDRAAL